MLNKLIYIFQKQQLRNIEERDINMEQLQKMVEKGAILVDIRSPQEYGEGHLQGSISIPEYEFRIKAKNILPDKNVPIIVYCGTGIRSKRAQKKLERMGYERVYNLYQGFESYC